MQTQELSDAQRALIPQVQAEWLRIALDTAAVDTEQVRDVLVELYRLADKRPPKRLIYLESPFQIAKTIAKLFLEGGQVSTRVNRQVNRQVCKKFADPLRERLRDHAVAQIPAPQIEPQGALVEAQINEHIRGVRVWPTRGLLDQFSDWLSWFDFIGRLGMDVSKLAPSFGLAKSCGWSLLFWDWAFVSARPKCIHRDDLGLLHCETGAAVR